MSYTQAQVDKLKEIRATGVLTIEYDGVRTTFRSDAELAAAIAQAEAEIAAASATGATTSSLAAHDRD